MIDEARIIEIKEDILSDNNTAAEAHRQQLAQQGTLFVDVMSSPGAGKTTLLLRLIERMRGKANIGIIEGYRVVRGLREDKAGRHPGGTA